MEFDSYQGLKCEDVSASFAQINNVAFILTAEHQNFNWNYTSNLQLWHHRGSLLPRVSLPAIWWPPDLTGTCWASSGRSQIWRATQCDSTTCTCLLRLGRLRWGAAGQNSPTVAFGFEHCCCHAGHFETAFPQRWTNNRISAEKAMTWLQIMTDAPQTCTHPRTEQCSAWQNWKLIF